jgi:nucleoside-diphosphate-sugar epimerase
MSIIIVGASSGPGRLLFESLRDDGYNVTGIARRQRDVVSKHPNAHFIEFDATDSDAFAKMLGEETQLIHCSAPEILTQLLALKPKIKQLIAIGSTRIYTRYPDDKCSRLAAMSHAIWMGDIPSILLHPTMIYGAPGLNNIERVIKIARFSPVIPLPENGDALIQPVRASDIARVIRACLARTDLNGRTIVIPGGQHLSYRRFVEICIKASGNNCKVVSMPYWLVFLLAPLTALIPGIPTIGQEEVRRLLEDKSFSTEDVATLLGFDLVDPETGLRDVIHSDLSIIE